MTLAVVIPAYNEAATIAAVIARARHHARWIIVVDDGSTDGTGALAEQSAVTLLRHEHNRGKAAALWHGMSHALQHGATVIITLDADAQHRPEDIPRLVAVSRRQPECIVIAARVRGREQVPGPRRFANRMANFWISWAAGHPIADTQSGFRLYPAAVLSAVRVPYSRRHGFVFESEILIEAAAAGYFTTAVPVEAIYSTNARPSHYRPARDTWRIVRMVATKLLRRGLYPQGLLRALGVLPYHAWRAFPESSDS